MRLMILLAIITAACTFYILHPLMKSRHGKMNEIGMFFLFALPIAAVLLYGLLGAPDIASRPALFETKGPRYEYRSMIRQEMEIMESLAHDPENRNIMMTLGTLRLQTGRPMDAIDILKIALDLYPDDRLLAEELGAAHYAAALTLMRAPEQMPQTRTKTLGHFESALHYTPNKALLYETIKKDFENFNNPAPMKAK